MPHFYVGKSLEDMIHGYGHAICDYYSAEEMGVSGNGKRQKQWREEIAARKANLDESFIPFLTMIASLSWLQGSVCAVEGVARVFHLMKAGHMAPPVVATCIKWLGADMEDAESVGKAVDRLVAIMNHRSSGWQKAKEREGHIPALEEALIFRLREAELKAVQPFLYSTDFEVD